MKKVLIIVDMQNDFITGSLKNKEAENILPKVFNKAKTYMNNNDYIIFTKDTHNPYYLETNEGKFLPIKHCIKYTEGHKVHNMLSRVEKNSITVEKSTFGYIYFDKIKEVNWSDVESIELVGTCTDICVISNALILKAMFPEKNISVDSACCAGSTIENHDNAIKAMKCCQINIL